MKCDNKLHELHKETKPKQKRAPGAGPKPKLKEAGHLTESMRLNLPGGWSAWLRKRGGNDHLRALILADMEAHVRATGDPDTERLIAWYLQDEAISMSGYDHPMYDAEPGKEYIVTAEQAKILEELG